MVRRMTNQMVQGKPHGKKDPVQQSDQVGLWRNGNKYATHGKNPCPELKKKKKRSGEGVGHARGGHF